MLCWSYRELEGNWEGVLAQRVSGGGSLGAQQHMFAPGPPNTLIQP